MTILCWWWLIQYLKISVQKTAQPGRGTLPLGVRVAKLYGNAALSDNKSLPTGRIVPSPCKNGRFLSRCGKNDSMIPGVCMGYSSGSYRNTKYRYVSRLPLYVFRKHLPDELRFCPSILSPAILPGMATAPPEQVVDLLAVV